MEFEHVPVLVSEVIEKLRIKPDGIYADGTIGGAGHAIEICGRLGKNGRLFGFDRDADAVAAARRALGEYSDRAAVIRGSFRGMAEELKNRGVAKVDGILLDLGVSSHQFNDAKRGFSYRFDAPLDMRMDQSQSLTAAEVVNSYAEEDLFHVIRDYGEERFAKAIARNICSARKARPVSTTKELSEIVKASIPAKAREGRGHPAKRTFQAVRIEVNDELKVLSDSLEGMIDLLTDGGRICVITFHSLEDRIVKECFRKSENPCVCPPKFPICVCGRKSKGVCITKKPIVPNEKEIRINTRSHSAKLRVFERRLGAYFEQAQNLEGSGMAESDRTSENRG